MAIVDLGLRDSTALNTLRDADPEAEVSATLAPHVAELGDSRPHLDSHPNRYDCRIQTRNGIVEENHQSVAEEPFQSPVVAVDDFTESFVIVMQLRGMATARHLQGTGLGGLLAGAGCERAAATDGQLVWARARDTALAFYLRHGVVVKGDGFVDAMTPLPHHLDVRRVA